MRFFSILLAVVVMTALFLFVLQRDALLGFAGIGADEAETGETAMSPEADAPDAVAPITERRVSIVALTSTAQTVENAIVLRGRTEALRQVTALAETSGRVVSEPLRKGSQVEAGQIMCQLDPGSRGANLAEAEARLLEARARVPEAESRVTEAAARFEEARINENAARRLAADGFASESRVAGADAALASAQSAVSSAITGLETVKAGIQSAEASVERAEQDITLLTITAPFAGVLETDTAEFGAFLNTQGGNANCGTILQLDPIKLVGFVPEADIELVQVG
ncbi:MAG: multidrug efflux system membrane fusion protein, partial [Sulfitobacter sp.]